MSTDTSPPHPPSNPKPIPPPPPTTATAKPNQIPPAVVKPPPQAVKLQFRDPNLPLYIPKSAQKKRRAITTTATTPNPTPTRTCCYCCCCLMWFFVVLLLLSVAVGATCGVFWILYRPQRPKFTVASLKLSNLTLTGNLDTDASGRLYTSGNLTISAKNPNSKMTTLYDVVSMSVFSNSSVLIANSSFQSFKSVPGNSTVMRFMFKNQRTLDLDAARGLRRDLMGKSVMGVRLELETRIGVQIGKWKTRKIGIRVTCLGLRVKVPVTGKMKKGSSADAGVSDDGKCEIDLSNKIWGFTF